VCFGRSVVDSGSGRFIGVVECGEVGAKSSVKWCFESQGFQGFCVCSGFAFSQLVPLPMAVVGDLMCRSMAFWSIKGHLLCPFLQDVILVSGVPRMYL